MNRYANTETISDEIATFIGPNWRDYRPIAEIVSVFVGTFGHVHIDEVPERIWAQWIRYQEVKHDTSRNYPKPGQIRTEYRNGVAGYVNGAGLWFPESLDF